VGVFVEQLPDGEAIGFLGRAQFRVDGHGGTPYGVACGVALG
jgi:hypothetical protein